MSSRYAVIVASDPHAGGSTGLLPPHGAKSDDGNVVLPNLWQEWAWDKWDRSWARAAELTAGCDKKIVILNGDLTDGYHHGTWQIITANPVVQRRIALEVLSPMKSLEPDNIYVVRGTSAHVGEQGNMEEEIASALDAVKDPETGNYSRWKLDLKVLGHRIQAFHHGKLGMYRWTEQAALQRLAWQIRTEYDNAEMTPPDLVFVAHRHRWGDSGELACRTRVLMSPGWQGATQYVHKVVATAGITPVGMWVAILEEDAEPVLHRIKWKPRESVVEEVG